MDMTGRSPGDPARWDGVAEAYSRSFGRLCGGAVPALLDSIEPLVGSERRLLDVGTGTGIVAVAAAERGFVVDAVDSEPTMIAFAKAHQARSDVSFRVQTVPGLPDASGTYGAATANFMVNHTPDPLAALQELVRVVRPGGTIGATIWPERVTALNALWTEVIDRAGAIRPVLPRLTPSRDFERTVDGLGEVMTESGVEEPDVSEVSWTFQIAPDDLWCAATAGLALIGIVYTAQEESIRNRMTDAFFDVTTPRLVDGELRIPMTAVLGVGSTADRRG